MKYAQVQNDTNDKVIVLMTDGVPSCASGGAPAANDTRATVDAITSALGLVGIRPLSSASPPLPALPTTA